MIPPRPPEPVNLALAASAPHDPEAGNAGLESDASLDSSE
uniref:Uncharacterized protein n=1 Tax=Peronospora matthiolae TaxID=2874970 RepID=A0AAV1UU83_9STRA